MLTKSKASACIITLFLSFVFSVYNLNIIDCKLKPCIINCFGKGFKSGSSLDKYSARFK